jgi:predicted TPR repeat methyltransferase
VTATSSAARRRWRRARYRLSRPYQFVIEDAVGDAETILDVGCGDDSPIRLFRRRRQTVGVDVYAPAIERSRAVGIHDEYHEADVRTIGELFGKRSFDVVMAIDLLEHLDEPSAIQLLASMEDLARQRVVLFTPNGFVDQGTRDGNPWQVHRSGWTAERLAHLGYQVSGVHGLKWLRGEEAQVRWRPERLWHLVSDMSEPLAARLPSIAFHLLGIKRISER